MPRAPSLRRSGIQFQGGWFPRPERLWVGPTFLAVGLGPRPEGCRPRLGDLMVLVRLSPAGADSTDHSPVVLQR